MLYYLFIIPTLGCIKNFVKYKKISLFLYFRTPLIYFNLYFIFKFLNYKNRISLIIINERIFMFLYKIFKAIFTDNYLRKKIKYKDKYNLNYNSNNKNLNNYLDNYEFLNISQ